MAALNQKASTDASQRVVAGIYARYVDDIVLITRSAGELHRLTAIIEAELRKAGLTLSPKTEPLPPMNGRDLRAWLMDKRGLGLQASGLFAAPPAEIPLAIVNPLADAGEVDRKDALALLHDSRMDEPTTTADEVCDRVMVALQATDLRHGDLVAAAKRLWRCIAQSEKCAGPAEAAKEMEGLWHKVGGPYAPGGVTQTTLADQMEMVLPAVIWLEGLERYLHARTDRSSLFSQKERADLEEWRRRIASCVADGLCEEICTLPTWHPALESSFKHMLEMRKATVLWAALQVLRGVATVGGRTHGQVDVGRFWPPALLNGALPRYHMSIAETLAIGYGERGFLNQAGLQPAGHNHEERNDLWLLHEACIRLAVANAQGSHATEQPDTDTNEPAPSHARESEDPLLPMQERLPLPDKCGSPLRQLLALLRPNDSSVCGGNATIGEDVWQAAFSLVCRGHEPVVLLSRRPWLLSLACICDESAVSHELLPWPPGVQLPLPALILFCYSQTGSPSSIPNDLRTVVLTGQSEGEGMRELSVEELLSAHFAPTNLPWVQVQVASNDFYLLKADWTRGTVAINAEEHEPPRADSALLKRVAAQFRSLVHAQRQCDGGKEVLPSAYALCGQGPNSLSLTGFIVDSGALRGQAFVRNGSRGLRVIGVPEEHSHLWRIGVALADYIGRPPTNTGFEGLRLSASATLLDGTDWAIEGMLRFGLAILQGSGRGARERSSQRGSSYLPASVVAAHASRHVLLT